MLELKMYPKIWFQVLILEDVDFKSEQGELIHSQDLMDAKSLFYYFL